MKTGQATPREILISISISVAFGVPVGLLTDNVYIGGGFGVLAVIVINNWYWMVEKQNKREATR